MLCHLKWLMTVYTLHNIVVQVSGTYMSTLPDSAGVSRIFENFLRKSRIDIFSRQERSFPRILRSSPGGKLHLCFTPFPCLVKGSDRRSREKGRDLTQSCDKNPYTHRTIQKATSQHKNATKNFDYTTIRLSKHASRLSKHASLTLINDCTICLIVLITSTGLITLLN